MRIPRWLPFLSATMLAVLTSVSCRNTDHADRPHNVILFISDGCGPASFTMARGYLQDVKGRTSLALDSILVGSIETQSTDSRVTDSAAGATAFACGVKTYNGAIAVDPEGRPFRTILEAAEGRGMATGLVVTSTIAHATPAAFSAHVKNRDRMDEIASQQIGKGIEVLFGGGKNQYLPVGAGGLRKDGRNLLEEAHASGYQILESRQDFDGNLRLPVLGLFAQEHMSYEIDRDPRQQPSLAEMTRKAISLLSTRKEGFFLMVEGSRIDHAAHNNDASAHLQDILAFDDAVAEALSFATRDRHTLIVSTSDHETGGLSLGRNIDGEGVYAWYPKVLARIKNSDGVIEEKLIQARNPDRILKEETGIGLKDLLPAERKEKEAFANHEESSVLRDALNEIVDRRAVVGWTTHGHTAVDINVYAYGPGALRFAAHHDNTYIGRSLAELLDVRIGLEMESAQE